MLRDFVARFKQAYPEVDVQFLDMGSRKVLERIRAERDRLESPAAAGQRVTTLLGHSDSRARQVIGFKSTFDRLGFRPGGTSLTPENLEFMAFLEKLLTATL